MHPIGRTVQKRPIKLAFDRDRTSVLRRGPDLVGGEIQREELIKLDTLKSL